MYFSSCNSSDKEAKLAYYIDGEYICFMAMSKAADYPTFFPTGSPFFSTTPLRVETNDEKRICNYGD